MHSLLTGAEEVAAEVDAAAEVDSAAEADEVVLADAAGVVVLDADAPVQPPALQSDCALQ